MSQALGSIMILAAMWTAIGPYHTAETTQPMLQRHAYTRSGSYSPLHYWAPTLWRVKMRCDGVQLGMYAPDRHPEIPPRYRMTTFPSPRECLPR